MYLNNFYLEKGMIDAVIPQNNEQAFLSIAEKLGYNSIILLYQENAKIPAIESKKIIVKIGILATKGGKTKKTTFLQSSEKDQQIIENNPPDVMYEFETKTDKDYIHQRASGLNQVLCKFAAKNNVVIAFSFAQLLNTVGTRPLLNEVQQGTARVRAQILGRIMQNIHLCRKYNVKTAIATFATQPHQMRAPKDLQALFVLLGMHPAEAKNAFETLN